MVRRNENQQIVNNKEIPTMTFVRSSRGRYLIQTQGYEIESKSRNIPPHIHHEMIDAAMARGRDHYESRKGLPGKITVYLPGRVLVNKPNNYSVDIN